MQNILAAERIATLLASYVVKKITPEEQKELDEWANANEENKLLFDKLTDANLIEAAEIVRLIRIA
jgi:hypothetical protein